MERGIQGFRAVSKKKNPLLRRKAALDATLEKYRARTFDWETGATCIHMFRFLAKRMGHKIEAVPKLDGPIAAKRELKKRGWDSVEEMLDALLTPIPVASMLPADVSVVPDDSGLGGIVISLGSTALGYAEGFDGMVMFTEPGRVLEKAWRI